MIDTDLTAFTPMLVHVALGAFLGARRTTQIKLMLRT